MAELMEFHDGRAAMPAENSKARQAKIFKDGTYRLRTVAHSATIRRDFAEDYKQGWIPAEIVEFVKGFYEAGGRLRNADAVASAPEEFKQMKNTEYGIELVNENAPKKRGRKPKAKGGE